MSVLKVSEWPGNAVGRLSSLIGPLSIPIISLILIFAFSAVVQGLVIEPALDFHLNINLWPYLFVGLGFLLLPWINCIAMQMALFFSISVISLLGLAEPLTGSHAAGTSPVFFGLSFFTATLAYHAARTDLRRDPIGRTALYGSALFIFTGPILTMVRAVRISTRRAYVATSYILLGFFMFFVVAKNIVPLLQLRDLASFWDVVLFGLIFEVFVYFNFCGLSLIIYGVTQICGLAIPLNFRQPFSARSIVHFWRAWHVTLAAVLKQVFYLRVKQVATTDISIIVVFFASAMWHGVTLNFLIWGLFHGALFIVSKYVLKRGWVLLAFAMLPPVLIFGRALFAENRTELLLEKISNVLALQGLGTAPMGAIEALLSDKLALLSLTLGLGFILLEVIDGGRRPFERRRYNIFRGRWQILVVVALICVLGQAGGGDVYAVYGQR